MNKNEAIKLVSAIMDDSIRFEVDVEHPMCRDDFITGKPRLTKITIDCDSKKEESEAGNKPKRGDIA